MRRWPELLAGPRTLVAVAVVIALPCAGVCGCAAASKPGSGRAFAAQTGHQPATGHWPTTGPESPSPRVTHAAAVKARTTPRPSARPPAPPAHFRTLPPAAKLPSGARCAAWVRARPLAENKRVNRAFNKVTGEGVGSHFFGAGDDPRANELLAPRISGGFTGTTAEILRWAACKWGIEENIVFAQAALESWWRQTTEGDFGTDASACPPGHGLGADGTAGQCPQSYGILQNRYPFERASWPGIGRSTAMNADTAYAIWRACFDGYEPWLNHHERGGQYHAGDAWGCVGRWFSGLWYAGGAPQYIGRVRTYLSERIWRQPDFQET